ncbi:hypothetical protein BFW01_g5056 [Lasiodiplodia theobromae]|nr:hypothetical protein BFW01_g5056 [Lasiodiplodia theobromae]
MSGFQDLKKTWFLVPAYDIPPSAIRIGYLIAKPLEPRHPINPTPTGADGSPDLGQSPKIDTEVFKDVEGPSSREISSDNSTTLGIFATFLKAIGINAEFKLTQSAGIKTHTRSRRRRPSGSALRLLSSARY